ncbi:MAG TPA: phosphopantetheine-binding protein, partial [Pseudomonadales bacterium]|nr:phosphopantetheine-binding protein [Pseudomonadales bacterium]
TFAATIAGQTKNEYVRTGDLGFLRDGELYVTGRSKDMMIIRGRNYYPQDIEQTIQNAHPALRKGSGAAFSVRKNGKEQLVIVQGIERKGVDSSDYEAIISAAIRAVTERHKISPYCIAFIAPGKLPKTSSGKIQRVETKRLFESGELSCVYVWKKAELVVSEGSNFNTNESQPGYQTGSLHDLVEQWVADRISIDRKYVDLDMPFAALGLDSVEAVEIIDRLQTYIGRTLPAIELFKYPTVKALIDHLDQDAAKNHTTITTKTKVHND